MVAATAPTEMDVDKAAQHSIITEAMEAGRTAASWAGRTALIAAAPAAAMALLMEAPVEAPVMVLLMEAGAAITTNGNS